jgi:hypothetical protein
MARNLHRRSVMLNPVEGLPPDGLRIGAAGKVTRKDHRKVLIGGSMPCL